MIHPSVELKKAKEGIGLGVYATKFIPKGTLTYVLDVLDIEISQSKFKQLPANIKSIVSKYSYIDPNGNYIFSWDYGKYINHNCNPNTINTGFGFEIAIRDIYPGEEITDEYGLFNPEEDMAVSCGCVNCRKIVQKTDIDRLYNVWDEQIKQALQEIRNVQQPLFDFMSTASRKEIDDFLDNKAPYKSVLTLKFNGKDQTLETQGTLEHA